MNRYKVSAIFLLAGSLIFGGRSLVTEAAPPGESTATTTPRPTRTPYMTRTPWPTAVVTKTPTAVAPVITNTAAAPLKLGWPGQVQCLNCTPFSARVSLSHYDPTDYNPAYPQLNCWNYSQAHRYCLSPTWIGVPWEAAWGWGAACPPTWAVGTWIEIPTIGYFICIDQGGEIVCDEENICRVDLMGPGGEPWDGKTFDVTLWVPPSFLMRLAGEE